MRSTYYSLVAKSHQYAQEKERIQVNAMELTIRGSNADHLVRLEAGRLRCDCDHFQHEGICAHVLAAEIVFRPHLPPDAVRDPYVERVTSNE